MVQSLKNLSHMAIARTFWSNHKFEKSPIGPPVHLLSAHRFSQRIETLELPKTLESELTLVIFEFATRKIAKSFYKMTSGLETQRCVGEFDKDSEKAKEKIVRNFFSDPGKWLLVPALNEFFPEKDQAQIAIKLFFALLMANPCEDSGRIEDFEECWASQTFVRSQSIFLDNFADIYSCILRATRNLLRSPERCGVEDIIHDLLKYMIYTFRYQINETVPWFVFEVLNTEQREKFFALGQTTLVLEERLLLRGIFGNVFCHWPWQDEAFDMFFARKQELNNNEMTLLQDLVKRIQHEENFLYDQISHPVKPFSRRIKMFFEAKKKAKSRARVME